jgi:hypothetical protein
MGLLEKGDWKARWIGTGLEEKEEGDRPCPLFRREFRLKEGIRSARAYVTSLGLYEMKINGGRVGDWLFTPGWTSYNKRLQYQTYDITEMVKPGLNAVGVTLGDGWYRGTIGWGEKRDFYGKSLALYTQLVILYQDGTREVIGSDAPALPRARAGPGGPQPGGKNVIFMGSHWPFIPNWLFSIRMEPERSLDPMPGGKPRLAPFSNLTSIMVKLMMPVWKSPDGASRVMMTRDGIRLGSWIRQKQPW